MSDVPDESAGRAVPAADGGHPPILAEVFSGEEAFGPPDSTTGRTTAIDGDEALRRRPKLTIRTRMTIAFALIFLLFVTITLWSWYALSVIESKLFFLEVADSYASEIHEARRYEKNFLLYGTNLEDAFLHLGHAQALLAESEQHVVDVAGPWYLERMRELAASYHAELEQLGQVRDEAVRAGVEAELRRSGGQMLALALEFRARERKDIDRKLELARRAPFLFLLAVFTLMTFISMFLARQMISVLRRFTEYTKRIGAGDFSPIAPARKFRDEFSQLAIALNRMVRELDHRERILVESHKLRAIGALVAGVAHELNNPLNNVMLTAAMAEEDFSTLSDEEKLSMIRDIISETERSKKIVGNLLDFARESETTVEPLDLGTIVDEATQLVANQVRMAGAHLVTRIPNDLPPVHGDRQMLCQVFVNLIINAIDVSPAHSEIEVAIDAEREDGYLAVDVTDQGPGIPEHVMAQVFDPFFTTKPRGKGTGLGLSVSKGIVRKLGGFLRVSSTVGAGSTFTVLLPVTRVPSDVSTLRRTS